VAVFHDAILVSAILTGSDLEKADFSGAVLDAADLSDTGLKEADFSGASLKGAALAGVNLEKADFADADLTGATFSDSDVEDADFTGAILVGADVSELTNVDPLDFRDAGWDDGTQLHADMDTELMRYLPEPGGTVSLLVGICALSALRRLRPRA